MLYRGLKLKKDEVDTYKVGSKIRLMGYISTSLQESVAYSFATKGHDKVKVPVVYEIDFRSERGLF